MTTLLMSSRHTEDDQALWRAAIGREWSVVRARGIRLPEELQAATVFAEAVLAATTATTPKAVVLDVGETQGRGWAVVEANGAWGSGIYGCDPEAVLDVIRHATVQPKQEGA